jgi:hypothetical protein
MVRCNKLEALERKRDMISKLQNNVPIQKIIERYGISESYARKLKHLAKKDNIVDELTIKLETKKMEAEEFLCRSEVQEEEVINHKINKKIVEKWIYEGILILRKRGLSIAKISKIYNQPEKKIVMIITKLENLK